MTKHLQPAEDLQLHGEAPAFDKTRQLLQIAPQGNHSGKVQDKTLIVPLGTPTQTHNPMKPRFSSPFHTFSLSALSLGLAFAGLQSVQAQTTINFANPPAISQTVSSTTGSPDITVTNGTVYLPGDIIRFTNANGNGSPFGGAANYYIVSVIGNDIQVATTPGGAALNATSDTTVAETQLSLSTSEGPNYTGGTAPNSNSEIAAFNSPTGGVPAFITTSAQTLYGLTQSGGGSDLLLASGGDGTGLFPLTFATNDASIPKISGSSTSRIIRLGSSSTHASPLVIEGNQGLIFNGRVAGALTGTGTDATSGNPAKNIRLNNVDWSGFSGGITVERGQINIENGLGSLPNQTLTVGNAQTTTNNTLANFSMGSAGATVDGLNGTSLGRISGNNTLSVGNDNGSGDYAGVIGRAFGATESNTNLTKNGTGTQTISGIIVGGGSVTANGGTLILNGANTYTGLTTINNGDTLRIGNAAALGSFGVGGDETQLNGGGILDLNGQAIEESFSNNDGTFFNSNTSIAAEVINEVVDKNNPEFDGPGDIIVNNIRRTNGITRRITKNGSGTLTLGGLVANNRYGLTVNGGDVLLNKPDGVDAVSRFPLIMNAGAGTVTLLAPNQIHNNTDGGGLHQINAGILDLNGFDDTLGYLTTTNGTETDGVVTNSDVGTTSTLTLAGNAELADFPGAITGNLALFKGNTNIQTLSGANTFTGGTTVGRGTLVLGTGGSFPATNTLVMGSGSNAGTLQLGDATGAVDTTVTSLSSGSNNSANQVVGGNATTVSVLTVNSSDPTVDTYVGRLGDGVAGDTDANRVSLVKQGTGALQIYSAGTYTGGTTIEDGVLSYGINGAFGTGDVTINGGRIGIGASGLTLANNILVGGDFAIGSESGLSGNASGLNVTGDINLGGGARDMTIRRTINISGVISNGALNFMGVGGGDSPDSGRRLRLQGSNTYLGGTTVTSGILEVDGDSLSDLGNLNLDGGNVDVTGTGNETVNTLTIGGNVIFAGTYSSADYSEIVGGQITVLNPPVPSGYDTWAATNAPTGTSDDDFDGDGVANAVEFVLGGLASTNDLDKLPTAEATGGNFVFSFIRDQQSTTVDTTVVIEVTTDLAFPGTTYNVGADTAGSDAGVTVVDNTDGTDTITLSVAQAPDPAKFARLKVVITE